MNEPVAIVAEAQAEALIEAIETHREQECDRLLAGARQEADQIVTAARHHARGRVHEAAEALRRDGARRIRDAKAARDTEMRWREQRELAALIERSWPRIIEALAQRWQEEPARRQWVRAALAMAKARLRSGAWRIDYPASGGDELHHELIGEIDALGIEEVEWQTCEDLAAGLRIHSDGATLDATPQALVQEHDRVEAALITEMNRLAAAQGEGNRPASEAEDG